MPPDSLYRKLSVLFSALLIIAGVVVLIWLLGNRPGQLPSSAVTDKGEPVVQVIVTPSPTPIVMATPLVLGISDNLPLEINAAVHALAAAQPGLQLQQGSEITAALRLDWDKVDAEPLYQQTFAVATKFNTIFLTMTLTSLQQLWQGEISLDYAAVAILEESRPALTQILGPAGENVLGYATLDEVQAAAWRKEPLTVAIVPFEQLVPSLGVFAIDGQNPVENANHYQVGEYPLVATVYLHGADTIQPDQQVLADALLRTIPPGNRDATRLTVIAMTGVTAMCRYTADRMDKNGVGWPAEVVGPELASADITHISNEVPFVPGCETDLDPNALVFCSKPEYMTTLQDSGADIIGLTGNHQNDFGKTDALQSLQIYAAAGLPVYGGGKNLEAARAPLIIEDHGNRLAFLGANSYGPDFAWADTDYPGSAPFNLEEMSAAIRTLKEKNQADVVLTELQYEESYDVHPLPDQRENFNSLVKAGADIVTGVQSHVPQALEFTDGKLILYGLGNLYFDQMSPQSVREGMIVKHTIYQGRHISTQILTTLLYDAGQPRWTTPDQRTSILQRVYNASYWE